MSRLGELIRTFCPNGVEYKPMGEIGTFTRGGGLQKKDFTESGVPCIHYGQIYTYYGAFAYETKSFVSPDAAKKFKKAQSGDLIIATTSENIEDVCKCVVWLGEGEICVSGETYIFKHKQNPKYVAYCLQTADFSEFKKRNYTGTKVIRIHEDRLRNYEIPIPPMEVQEEIVRILDKFTAMEAELEAELEARKKQYEHYRDTLLSFTPPVDEKIAYRTMGEIGTFIRGNGLQKKDFTESGVPCIHYGQIYTHYGTFAYQTKSFVSPEDARKFKKAQSGDLIIATTSENIDDVCKCVVWLGEGEMCVSGETYIFKHEQNPKYIAYCLQTANFFEFKKRNYTGTKVIRIHEDKLKSYVIPIPPIEEQERIVGILDKFEALCTDLCEGLPAEIEARRRQYEHYRDKLLSFKRI